MTILDFNELRLKYEGVLVDCINTEILKNPILSQSIFAISGTAGNKGQSMWMKDPFLRNTQLNLERGALSQASKLTHKWLIEFLDEAALHYCNRIVKESPVSWITKSFRDSNLSGTHYTWQFFGAPFVPGFLTRILASFSRVSSRWCVREACNLTSRPMHFSLPPICVSRN